MVSLAAGLLHSMTSRIYCNVYENKHAPKKSQNLQNIFISKSENRLLERGQSEESVWKLKKIGMPSAVLKNLEYTKSTLRDVIKE